VGGRGGTKMVENNFRAMHKNTESNVCAALWSGLKNSKYLEAQGTDTCPSAPQLATSTVEGERGQNLIPVGKFGAFGG